MEMPKNERKNKKETPLVKTTSLEETHKHRIEQAQWYIVNCNKGHEDKVAADLKNKIEKIKFKR